MLIYGRGVRPHAPTARNNDPFVSKNLLGVGVAYAFSLNCLNCNAFSVIAISVGKRSMLLAP